jgi:PKD repeat protein
LVSGIMKITRLALALLLLVQAAYASTLVLIDFPEGYEDIAEEVDISGTALDAFSAVANLTTENYTFGTLVTGVNGVMQDTEAGLYWMFYVDYEQASVGTDGYALTGEDVVELAYTGEWVNPSDITFYAGIEGVEIYLNGIHKGTTNSSGVMQKSMYLRAGTYDVKAAKENMEGTAVLTVMDYSSQTMTIELQDAGAFERAIQWLKDNEKGDGEIGGHKVWGTAFAVMALSLCDEDTDRGRDYLLSYQNDDGGFEYPGYGSDALHTSLALMALESVGYRNSDLEKAGGTPVDFLLSKQRSDGGFTSWIDSDVDTTSWASMALLSAGKEPGDAIDYLLEAQNADGGYGYQSRDNGSSVEYTAEAVMAIGAAGAGSASEAIDYLKANDEDCFGNNAYLASLAILALRSYGENSGKYEECLETLQLGDGGFGRDGEKSNSVDTGVAIIALSGETMPVSIENETGQQGELTIPVNAIVKFTITVENAGDVDARNIWVELEGIEPAWITGESDTSINSLRPENSATSRIYVEFPRKGVYTLRARVISDQGTGNSSALTVRAEGTTFKVTIEGELE